MSFIHPYTHSNTPTFSFTQTDRHTDKHSDSHVPFSRLSLITPSAGIQYQFQTSSSFFFFFLSSDLDETFLCILGDIFFPPVDHQEVTWTGKIMMIHLSAVVSETVWAHFRAIVKTHYFNCNLMWCFTEYFELLTAQIPFFFTG